MEMANQHFNAYSMFSTGWFFDYFAINQFGRLELATLTFPSKNLWRGSYQYWRPTTFEAASTNLPESLSRRSAAITVGVAEKTITSTNSRLPIQLQYRPDNAEYREAYDRFSSEWDSGRVSSNISGWAYLGILRGFGGKPNIVQEILRISGELGISRHPIKSFFSVKRILKEWRVIAISKLL
jgi:hypothetical protein